MKTHSLVLPTLFALLSVVFSGCRTLLPRVIHTEKDYKEFWGAHVRPFVVQRRMDPLLAKERDRLLRDIQLQYGQRVCVHVITNYPTLNMEAMDAYVTNSVDRVNPRVTYRMPVIQLFLPVLMDIRTRCYKFGADPEGRYTKSFEIDFFHQLNRLAYGHVSSDMSSRRSSLVRLRQEKATWPITISNIVELLVTCDNQDFYIDDEVMYRAWLAAIELGRPQLWDDYLKRRYTAKPP